jgi:BirA family biotin operon repressor/biotin-[acetyl-CoA-carboxylase] ligase
MRFLPLITLMTGVAVHDTLENAFGLDCDIKWANDIHINGKKICGILAESCETVKGLAVIVGIGINLRAASFPAELAGIITSVEAETDHAPSMEILLESLTKHLANYYEILQGENGAAKIRQEWTEKSSYAFGKDVRVTLENETILGTTRGIEENGALRVETQPGEIKIVQAGDVENLRKV